MSVTTVVACVGLLVAYPLARTQCAPGACEVVLHKVATLSAEGRANLFPEYSLFVVQDRLGRFFTTSRSWDQVLVFERSGRLSSVLASADNGVYRRITNLIPIADGSILVHDSILRRTFIVGPDLKVRRTVPVALRPTFVLDGDKYVVAEQVPTTDLAGQPIHIIDGDGRVIRSFGANTGVYRADQQLMSSRIVAPGDGRIWVVAPGRYVLEQWSPATGELMQSTIVQSSWFKEARTYNYDERIRPTAIIQALWVTGGIGWVLLRDADTNWQPPARPNVERPVTAAENDRMYDWVLEAVDTKSGRVLASKRFGSALWVRPTTPLVTSRAEQGGAVNVDVWTVALSLKEERQ
jgi:hypothetical protein